MHYSATPAHFRPWYREWWGVLTAIITLPVFLMWYLWFRSSRKRSLKLAYTVVLVVFGLLACLSLWPNSKADTKPTAVKASSQAAAPDITSQAPAAKQSAATATSSTTPLGSQAAVILHGGTDYYENLFKKVQADAGQSDALSDESAFHNDKQKFDIASDNTNLTTAAKASDVYANAHAAVPPAINGWSATASQLYTDIQKWTDHKWQLLTDQKNGNNSSPHANDVSVDEQAYKDDLAKLNGYISQL